MGFTLEALEEVAAPKSAEIDIQGVGKVPLRAFNERERGYFADMLNDKDAKEKRRARAWLLSRCLLDSPGGKPIAADDKGINRLLELNGLTFGRIFDALITFSGYRDEEVLHAGESSAETGELDTSSD